MIHTGSSSLVGCHSHIELIDLNVCLQGASSTWRSVLNNMLPANFIDLHDQWVSLRRSKSHDVVNYSLLERCSTRVHAVDATNFNYQFQGILSHLCVFVRNPLASELGQLLIVFANDDLERLTYEIFLSFDHASSFNEKSKSSNNRFFALSRVTNHLGNYLTHGIGSF